MNRFTVFADYFQFVLMDEKSEDDFSAIWTDEALDRMLAVGSDAVCPGTLRNVDVRVEIEVLSAPPAVDLAKWDHAVEASLNVPSGKLVVMGCTDYLPAAKRIEVKPGNYQLLSLASGIDSIQTEWEPADDVYRVYLWLGEPRAPNLIKKWQRADAWHRRQIRHL
ncbi:MAG: hypothetical protein JNN20_09770 [Betaproteobacteria bacterium]|nr:hypothetical protein [Betaproteobacteria bacterium]